jgi:hypothetical protein
VRRPPPPSDDPDDGWRVSTEGDLDPDLTEEAGYAGWEPPRRRWGPLLLKVALALLLLAMILGVLAPVLL